MTKRKPPNVQWDSFVEQQIREAQEAGKFDDLPGMGRPIDGIDEPYDENWWLKKKMRSERISLLPPALEILADVDRTLRTVHALPAERDVRHTIESLNERIRKANFAAWGPSTSLMPLDVDKIVKEWNSRRDVTPTTSF